jgi:ATP-binding cassette, subfamily C (CFTR/MRP), member 4
LVSLYLFTLIAKYFALNMSILCASAKIHENMVEAIVRSPARFFDITPSGTLANKFSTDLGVIDNALVLGFIDTL